MHQTRSNLKQKFNTFLAKYIIIDPETFRLLHYQFFFHISFYKFNEFIIKDVFVCGILLVTFILLD
jgi:hypothetical protein